jgi:hypothetical protein
MGSRELTATATEVSKTERSLRPELVAAARGYMDAARSENTRRAYSRA